MAYSSPTDRPRVISGLRDVAGLLEARPELPAPSWVDVSVHVPRGNDRSMRAEVDRVAGLLGSKIDPEHVAYGHYCTALRFGPVQYRVIAVLSGARARHEALVSYSGAVVPDAPKGV